MSDWWGLIWIFSMFGLHEFGHYLVAKHHGIFKGFSVIPFGFAVNMTTYLRNRWEYLAGIAMSCLAFPLFWVIEPALRGKSYIFFVMALGTGIMDIVVFLLHSSIAKELDKAEAEGRKVADIGIPIFRSKGWRI